MAKKSKKDGPKLPLARMERAVEFRMLGYKWGEIEKLTRTPIGTLWRWAALPEWKQLEDEWARQDPIARRARAVVARALMHDLASKGRPDTALAERLLAKSDGDGEGAGGFGSAGVILLPLQNKGLESKPATQVLIAPPKPPEPPPVSIEKPPAGKKPTGKRRVVGPDEE